MTAVFAQIPRDPSASPSTRRAIDRLRQRDFVVDGVCIDLDEQGRLTVSTTLDSQQTQTGNSAGAETTLFTYTVPADTLANNGESLEFRIAGTYSASGSANKRIILYFGGTAFFDSGGLTVASKSWSIRGSVTRIGTASQKCEATLSVSGNTRVDVGYATAAETLSGAVILKITGNGTSASDVVAEVWKVSRSQA